MANEVLSARILRDFFDYDPDGVLIWKERPTVFFLKVNAQNQIRAVTAWNSKFVGRPALCTENGNGYKAGRINGKKYYLHRCVWAWHNGYWPPEDIDHINRDRADNRIENLRAVTRSQNLHNKRMSKRNRSGVRGVCWDNARQKWMAQIQIMRRNKTIGHFDDIKDAEAAYLKAAEVMVWGAKIG